MVEVEDGTTIDLSGVDLPGPASNENRETDRASPDPDPDASPRSSASPVPLSHVIRLSFFVVVLVLCVVLALVTLWSTGPPTVDELRRKAGLSGREELVVGVFGDIPGISEWHEGDVYTGFDVEIAYLVANAWGFTRQQVRFLEVTTEDRQRMQGMRHAGSTYEPVDIVVASYSITDKRKRKGSILAGPYLRTEPSVLTARGHPVVSSLADLGTGGGPDRTAPQRVCTPGTSTSLDRLKTQSRAQVFSRQRTEQCVEELLAGRYDAVVTDAAVLAGFAARHRSELKLNNPATTADEWWGVLVGYDPQHEDERAEARKTLALLALEDALDGRAWREAFDAHLAPLGSQIHPPGEEKPQAVADPRQPAPWEKASVRRWPWERFADGRTP
jgi:glutamate transport system substrate-binding protein